MSKCIMMIDDNPEILELCGFLFQHRGYTVLKALDAESALQMLKDSTPDVFIVDVMMPEINGIELCQRIRALPQHEQTPVLFLSAYSNSEIVVEAISAGGNEYVFKPVDPGDLEAKVREVLEEVEQ